MYCCVQRSLIAVSVLLITIGSFVPAKASVIDDCTILFIGTSLTYGAGLSRDSSFPGRIERTLNARGFRVKAKVVAKIGGSTETILSAVEASKLESVDVAIVEVGFNDAMHRMPIGIIGDNVGKLLRLISSRWPTSTTLLMTMRAPWQSEEAYSDRLSDMYETLAEQNRVDLVPWIMAGIINQADMTQYDGIHPNSQGHERIAEKLLSHVVQALRDDGDCSRISES